MKTVLAPNAPWYDLTPPPPPPPRKRKKRVKPAQVDKKFAAWLDSIKEIK